MAAQYILEHSLHMTPDPDGFKCSMKNIVKSHLCNPFNVSNRRYSLRSPRDRRDGPSLSQAGRFLQQRDSQHAGDRGPRPLPGSRRRYLRGAPALRLQQRYVPRVKT
ncbi:hypothetical protein DBV15_10433 [Temnothorax longispinosus]|uniref:Uncharacterized protein n=1 Tax=Temnothorax longispinosus TaxID=300112 RepID=A0A4S2KU96_9HYME|nr:hypothetical protein DBV15_10433 [Temnothorax longispinosus]